MTRLRHAEWDRSRCSNESSGSDSRGRKGGRRLVLEAASGSRNRMTTEARRSTRLLKAGAPRAAKERARAFLTRYRRAAGREPDPRVARDPRPPARPSRASPSPGRGWPERHGAGRSSTRARALSSKDGGGRRCAPPRSRHGSSGSGFPPFRGRARCATPTRSALRHGFEVGELGGCAGAAEKGRALHPPAPAASAAWAESGGSFTGSGLSRRFRRHPAAFVPGERAALGGPVVRSGLRRKKNPAGGRSSHGNPARHPLVSPKHESKQQHGQSERRRATMKPTPLWTGNPPAADPRRLTVGA